MSTLSRSQSHATGGNGLASNASSEARGARDFSGDLPAGNLKVRRHLYTPYPCLKPLPLLRVGSLGSKVQGHLARNVGHARTTMVQIIGSYAARPTRHAPLPEIKQISAGNDSSSLRKLNWQFSFRDTGVE